MSVRGAYFLLLVLSLVYNVDESSSFLFPPASANLLFRVLRTLNFSRIFRVWDELSSFMRAHSGRLRIGDVVDGIDKIQDYLQLFGYLNSTLNSNFTDKFSAELESAIEYFQKTFNLNLTGQPDNATVSLIRLPRCGIPDVINGSSTTLENSTTSFRKWWPEEKKELTYVFSPGNETASLKDVFSDAFRRWSEVTMLNFTETTSFNESDIQIVFLPLDGKLGVVGGAWPDNTTRSWDVVLDSDEKWMLPSENTTESNQLDLESAVMHQIGHVLGLSHSSVEEAVMYPFILPSKKRRVDFAEDDLERIQLLYSTKSVNGELSPAQKPSSDGSSMGGAWPRWDLISSLWLGIILVFWF